MAYTSQGGIDAMRAMAYHTPSQHEMERWRETSSGNDNRLTSRALERISDVRTLFEPFDFSGVRRKVKAAMRKVDRYWTADMVKRLDDIADFQHPPRKMRPFIMAEPTIRRMYQENRAEGYGEYYDDVYKGRIAEDDPVYQKVTNGMWMDDPETGGFTITEYWPTEEHDQITELEFEDQVDILHTWENLRILIDQADDDPTSPWNGKL